MVNSDSADCESWRKKWSLFLEGAQPWPCNSWKAWKIIDPWAWGAPWFHWSELLLNALKVWFWFQRFTTFHSWQMVKIENLSQRSQCKNSTTICHVRAARINLSRRGKYEHVVRVAEPLYPGASPVEHERTRFTLASSAESESFRGIWQGCVTLQFVATWH